VQTEEKDTASGHEDAPAKGKATSSDAQNHQFSGDE
jgi:hypothetical protein